MPNCKPTDLYITGLGVTSSIGQGVGSFSAAMFAGRQKFTVMQRPGRQHGNAFIGAEITELSSPERVPAKIWRSSSLSGQVAMVTLEEAWQDANLDQADPKRIGLVIGGSNLQQRDLVQLYERYRDKVSFVPPSYGVSFLDSDLCGLCTQQFGIQGFAYTVGGASASGQVAVIQAIQAVQSGQVDTCIAMGAMLDISYWECQALQSLGAMGTERYAHDPAKACRPFDQGRDGFIYGENCGVLVIERAETAALRQAARYAKISGWAMGMDANRNPNPSYEGEVRVIKEALKHAGLSAKDIDYINPHGTGSPAGDDVELRALRDCGLSHASINATKSLIGHGLSAAGTIELIATVLQMRASRMHPTLNLIEPIDPSLNWVREKEASRLINHAISLSMGFGGMNTAVCLQKIESAE
ncbi:beta-ketoacyl synthase N-terminal-like domain-containing protein [Paenibacillus donghaensis]|uniref:Polyketide beta-ketoacyl:ACP synthase n=1 Tax=Paenibacillus donghaensis TaxID=414771 RepID=A0A2Z2KLM3_9BACL|nr:beta-ketoacyl synthase N-terminal-like domain-containing protein [Paenibacillus donghaensis]ASA19518.1 polyketide beta-ketoacyl:ACP synthase [Paenibacillus donghaensis]